MVTGSGHVDLAEGNRHKDVPRRPTLCAGAASDGRVGGGVVVPGLMPAPPLGVQQDGIAHRHRAGLVLCHRAREVGAVCLEVGGDPAGVAGQDLTPPGVPVLDVLEGCWGGAIAPDTDAEVDPVRDGTAPLKGQIDRPCDVGPQVPIHPTHEARETVAGDRGGLAVVDTARDDIGRPLGHLAGGGELRTIRHGEVLITRPTRTTSPTVAGRVGTVAGGGLSTSHHSTTKTLTLAVPLSAATKIFVAATEPIKPKVNEAFAAMVW